MMDGLTSAKPKPNGNGNPVLFRATLAGFHTSSNGLGDEAVLVSFDGGPSAPVQHHDVCIHDARALQESCVSASHCFEKYGFALLKSHSSVPDWDAPPDDVAEQYHGEVESLLREQLMPNLTFQLDKAGGRIYQRRGPGTPNEGYAGGVHQDYGFGPESIEDLLRAAGERYAEIWRTRFDSEDILAYSILCFWRTVNMGEPLRHRPLVVCDPNTVSLQDLVPVRMTGHGSSIDQVGLRFHKRQCWYAYRHMTPDEVLVFRQCHLVKATPDRWMTCFHTSTPDPEAPEDAPLRQSCEFRARVWTYASPAPTEKE